MPPSENRSALTEAIRNWNAGHYEAYLNFYAPDVVLHGFAPGLPPGRAGAEAFYSALWAAYPNSQITIHTIISEGDLLACRFSLTGVQQGIFMGSRAAGRKSASGRQTMMRFSGGQCVERWNQTDMLGWLQQLGVVAMPA